MDPRDFQQLAERLARGTAPADRRTAIGRAYYAAFNVAADGLRSFGFPIARAAPAHGEINYCLWNSGNPTLTAQAQRLEFLRRMRNRADYELNQNDVENPTNVRKAIEAGREFIQSVDTVLTGPERASIHATIAKWRRENGYP